MTFYLNILRDTDIFYQLSAEQIETIADLCQEMRFDTGEFIFDEGTSGDELYVIVQGSVDIMLDPSLVSEHPEEKVLPSTIATLRSGQSFGEIALVDQGIRSASARAAQDHTHLLRIPRQQLLERCTVDPQLGFHLMYNLAADLAFKIRSADLRIREELLYTQSKK